MSIVRSPRFWRLLAMQYVESAARGCARRRRSPPDGESAVDELASDVALVLLARSLAACRPAGCIRPSSTDHELVARRVAGGKSLPDRRADRALRSLAPVVDRRVDQVDARAASACCDRRLVRGVVWRRCCRRGTCRCRATRPSGRSVVGRKKSGRTLARIAPGSARCRRSRAATERSLSMPASRCGEAWWSFGMYSSLRAACVRRKFDRWRSGRIAVHCRHTEGCRVNRLIALARCGRFGRCSGVTRPCSCPFASTLWRRHRPSRPPTPTRPIATVD